MKTPYQGTAVITGASAGIGADFARQLAELGMDTILIARRKDRLEEVASEVRAKGRKAEIVVADLFNTTERQQLSALFLRNDVTLLINNAGYGKVGAFCSLKVEDTVGQVELNCVALTEIAYMAAKAFQQKRRGTILNLGSVAGFLPLPYFSVYAATKAYVQSFSESLAEECKLYNVQVSVLCPGPTKTEFGKIAGHTKKNPIKSMPVETCVKIALRDLARGKTTIVTGIHNKAIVFLARVLPRCILLPFAGKAANH